MDELANLVDRAADLAAPADLDVETLVRRTRTRRRRRAQLQVAGSTGAVALVAAGSALFLASPAHPRDGGLTGAPATRHPTTSHASPASGPTATATRLRPTVVNPTLRVPPPAGPTATPRNLPPGLDGVCGKPGSRLEVRILPVVIPYRICDVRGVDIVVGGLDVTVPTTFGYATVVEAAHATVAPPAGRWLQAETDKKTGDVTITGR